MRAVLKMPLVVLVACAFVSIVAPGAAVAQDPYWDTPCAPDWLPGPLRGLAPQEFHGADFLPACRVHDHCYETCGVTRRQCDVAFRANLHDACCCSQFPCLCRMKANSMYWLVRLFGRPSYRSGQRESGCYGGCCGCCGWCQCGCCQLP